MMQLLCADVLAATLKAFSGLLPMALGDGLVGRSRDVAVHEAAGSLHCLNDVVYVFDPQ